MTTTAKKALVIITDRRDWTGSLVSVAGLPLLERLVLAARECGVEEFHLLVPGRADVYRESIRGGEELGARLHWHGPETTLTALLEALERDKKPTLVFTTDMLFDHHFLSPLRNAATDRVAVLTVNAGDRAAGGVVLLPEPASLLAGLGPVVPNATIRRVVQDLVRTCIRRLAERGDLATIHARGGFWAPLCSRRDVKPAVRGLFGTLRKSTDGFVSRKINRPVSLTMTRLLIRLPVHPNVWTLFNLLIGLASAWFAARGDYWSLLLGGLMLQLNSIFDGCDGEIARLRFQTSRLGSLLDTLVDNLSTGAFVIGLVIGLWRQTGSWIVPLMAWLFVGLAAVYFSLTLFFLLRYGRTASLIAIFRPLQAAIDRIGGLRGAALRAGSKLLKRDLHVFLFFLCVLAGQGWIILALADLGMLVLTAVVVVIVLTRRDWLIAHLGGDSGDYSAGRRETLQTKGQTCSW